MSASGGFYFVVNEEGLIGDAGSQLKDAFQSPPDVTVIDVQARPNTPWTVYAKLTAPHPKLKLYARRTSSGDGIGSITGGENFIPLKEANTRLFSGIGPINRITIQYMIKGVTLEIPPGVINFNVVFSVDYIP